MIESTHSIAKILQRVATFLDNNIYNTEDIDPHYFLVKEKLLKTPRLFG